MTDLEPVTEAQKTVFTAKWAAVISILRAIDAIRLPGVQSCAEDIVRNADDVKAILERYIAARDGQRDATP